jgi:hypothetical protein
VRLQSRVFCGNEVTPELQNPHTRRFYRQAIPTGLATEALIPGASRLV